jgi:tetratricopeptide (TPR) repeat protein
VNFNAKWLLLIPVLLVAVGLGLFIPRLLDSDDSDDLAIIEEGNLSAEDKSQVTETLDEISDYEQLVASSPDDVSILKPLADDYFGLAQLEAQSGQTNDSFIHYKSAVDNYQKILVLQPDNAAVRLSLGLAYDGLLMREVAYRELRSVETSDPVLLFDLASALNLVGLFSEAKQALDGIVTDDPELLINVALEYTENLQLYTEAEAAVLRATDLAPDNQRAWLTLGFILKAAGKEEESRIALEKAVELDPESPMAEEAQNFLAE